MSKGTGGKHGVQWGTRPLAVELPGMASACFPQFPQPAPPLSLLTCQTPIHPVKPITNATSPGGTLPSKCSLPPLTLVSPRLSPQSAWYLVLFLPGDLPIAVGAAWRQSCSLWDCLEMRINACEVQGLHQEGLSDAGEGPEFPRRQRAMAICVPEWRAAVSLVWAKVVPFPLFTGGAAALVKHTFAQWVPVTFLGVLPLSLLWGLARCPGTGLRHQLQTLSPHPMGRHRSLWFLLWVHGRGLDNSLICRQNVFNLIYVHLVYFKIPIFMVCFIRCPV